MNQEFIIYLGSRALLVVAELAGPILAASLIIGILVAVFQSATQIQEMTLTFLPKIVISALLLLFLSSWMGSKIVSFTVEIFRAIPSLVGT